MVGDAFIPGGVSIGQALMSAGRSRNDVCALTRHVQASTHGKFIGIPKSSETAPTASDPSDGSPQTRSF